MLAFVNVPIFSLELASYKFWFVPESNFDGIPKSVTPHNDAESASDHILTSLRQIETRNVGTTPSLFRLYANRCS